MCLFKATPNNHPIFMSASRCLMTLRTFREASVTGTSVRTVAGGNSFLSSPCVSALRKSAFLTFFRICRKLLCNQAQRQHFRDTKQRNCCQSISATGHTEASLFTPLMVPKSIPCGFTRRNCFPRLIPRVKTLLCISSTNAVF